MPLSPGRATASFILALLASGAAFAQEAPRPRTGPDSAPPALPPYAEPLPEPAPAPPAAAPETAGQTGIRRILVVAETEGVNAVPPRAWRPPEAGASGLHLDHRRGEALDSAWVRRQLALNGIEGEAAVHAVALVQLINRAFVTAGFVNSGLLVAPQDPAAPDLLTLRLVHGRLAPAADGEALAVEFADGRRNGLDADYVRRRMPSARRRPLSALGIERDFRLLAEDPAIRTVNAQLRPGLAPGEASLALSILPRERVDLYVSAANNRSPSVGGERIALGGLLRNLVRGGDLLSGEIGLTEGALDGSAAYAVPLIDSRTIFSVRGSLNRAAVVDRPLVPLDISSRERGVEASLTRNLVQSPLTPLGEGRWSPSRRFSVGIGFAYRHQRSFLFGQPFSFAPGSVDGKAEYMAGRLLADLVLRNVDQVFALSLTGTVGIEGTRSELPFVLNPDRHFQAVLAQANYARRLSPRGLELRARLTGQWSGGTLYSGERLSIGGESSVRGYRESLILADRGLVGSVELARPFSLSRRPAGGRAFDWGAFSAGIFADAAIAWNARGPAPAPKHIAGIGPTLAWQPSDALSLNLAYGIALVDADAPGTRDLQDRGLHVRLTLHPLRLLR